MASPKVGATARAARDLRRMPGWIAASLGAERIGVSRQYMFDLINAKKIEAYGIKGTGERPACIVVREATVDRLAAERKARQGCPQCRAQREAGTEPETCTHAPVAVPDGNREIEELLGV